MRPNCPGSFRLLPDRFGYVFSVQGFFSPGLFFFFFFFFFFFSDIVVSVSSRFRHWSAPSRFSLGSFGPRADLVPGRFGSRYLRSRVISTTVSSGRFYPCHFDQGLSRPVSFRSRFVSAPDLFLSLGRFGRFGPDFFCPGSF